MTTEFWDKRSKKYDDAIKDHDIEYVQTITAANPLLSSTDLVLDFACASGEFGLDLAPYVQRIYGIDTSAKMVELAKEMVKSVYKSGTRGMCTPPRLMPGLVPVTEPKIQ